MNIKDLKHIQNHQLCILKQLDYICQRESINFYMAYGSLLGTIRHQGTIPWDYDIDVFMTRSEFIRLYEVINDYLPVGLVFKCLYSNNKNIVGLARIYDVNTHIFHKDHYEKNRLDGIHIDIFILDYARAYSTWSKKIILSLCKFLSIAQLDSFEKKWLYNNFNKNLFKRLIVRSSSIISCCLSPDSLQHIISFLVTSKKVSRAYITLLDLKENSYWPVRCFEQFEFKMYEDLIVKVPYGYDELLKLKYNNYLELPPEEERYTSIMEDYIFQDFHQPKV